MPGYAYPIATTSSESGTFRTLNAEVNEYQTAFYGPSSRTRVLSVLATNSYGTILPVKLYVSRVGMMGSDEYLLCESRVLKSKYMVQQLVSGDSRVNDSGDQQLDKYKVIADFVLQAGDVLSAFCPIGNAITLTVNVKEGI